MDDTPARTALAARTMRRPDWPLRDGPCLLGGDELSRAVGRFDEVRVLIVTTYRNAKRGRRLRSLRQLKVS